VCNFLPQSCSFSFPLGVSPYLGKARLRRYNTTSLEYRPLPDKGEVMADIRQSDERAKCPACGWGLDAAAYRCPKCLIYFCHKCRVRVSKGDAQYECANQNCGRYGKLTCGDCLVLQPYQGYVTRHPYTGIGSFFGICSCICLFIAFFFVPLASWGWTSFFAFLGGGIICGVIGAWCSESTITSTETVGQNLCCVQCRNPVKSR